MNETLLGRMLYDSKERHEGNRTRLFLRSPLLSFFSFFSRYPHGKLEFFLVEALVLVGLLLC